MQYLSCYKARKYKYSALLYNDIIFLAEAYFVLYFSASGQGQLIYG